MTIDKLSLTESLTFFRVTTFELPLNLEDIPACRLVIREVKNFAILPKKI